MPSTEITVSFNVRIHWWVRPYLETLGFLCELFDTEPDYEKAERIVMRGIVITRKPSA